MADDGRQVVALVVVEDPDAAHVGVHVHRRVQGLVGRHEGAEIGVGAGDVGDDRGTPGVTIAGRLLDDLDAAVVQLVDAVDVRLGLAGVVAVDVDAVVAVPVGVAVGEVVVAGGAVVVVDPHQDAVRRHRDAVAADVDEASVDGDGAAVQRGWRRQALEQPGAGLVDVQRRRRVAAAARQLDRRLRSAHALDVLGREVHAVAEDAALEAALEDEVRGGVGRARREGDQEHVVLGHGAVGSVVQADDGPAGAGEREVGESAGIQALDFQGAGEVLAGARGGEAGGEADLDRGSEISQRRRRERRQEAEQQYSAHDGTSLVVRGRYGTLDRGRGRRRRILDRRDRRLDALREVLVTGGAGVAHLDGQDRELGVLLDLLDLALDGRRRGLVGGSRRSARPAQRPGAAARRAHPGSRSSSARAAARPARAAAARGRPLSRAFCSAAFSGMFGKVVPPRAGSAAGRRRRRRRTAAVRESQSGRNGNA